MKKIIQVSAILCVMAGCFDPAIAQESSPAYLRDKLPEHWSYTTDMEQNQPGEDDWWRNFDDPTLDSLIAEGVRNNFNISMAFRRINMANSQMRQAMSAYFPSIGLNAGYINSRNAGASSRANGASSITSYFSLGAEMNWEVDIFGKIRSQVNSKKASLKVSKAEYDGTMLSIAASIATYYVNLRTYQEELSVTKEHLASQAKVVEITKARFEAGLVSKLDVTQAETVYYSTESQIPQLEASLNQTFNALAILLGIYPEKLHPRLDFRQRQPQFRHLVATGIPADLLRRRPDIIAAESQLAVYAAETGIAKKDFLPSLTLNGSIGVASHKAGNMFKGNSFKYSISPTLSWTLFDGLSRKYALQETKEQMAEGIDNYNLTVLTAINEVDNAMSSYLASLRTIDSDTKGLEQSSESFELSMNLYKQGLTPFTNVVDAQINSLTYANSLIAARGQALVSLINLYKALGGSFTSK